MAQKGGQIVLKDNMNGPRDGGDKDEIEPDSGDVGIGVFGDKDWVRGVAVIIDGCPSKADAVEDAVDAFLWRNDIKELNEGTFVEDIV